VINSSLMATKHLVRSTTGARATRLLEYSLQTWALFGSVAIPRWIVLTSFLVATKYLVRSTTGAREPDSYNIPSKTWVRVTTLGFVR
jgi:hypothetical protein